MGQLPGLDGLRGLAISWVFLVHLYAPVFSGGNAGVDLFFVLSGFLITKLAIEEHQRSTTFSLKQFYLRRVFRIAPALFALLAVVLVASFTVLSDVGINVRKEILLTALSAGNLFALFFGSTPRPALGHTWSLGLEEQFYLIWPFVLAFSALAFTQPRRFMVRVAGITLASVVIGRVVFIAALDYPHWQSIPLLNFDGLAMGCIIAYLAHGDVAGRFNRIPQWMILGATAIAVTDLFAAAHYVNHDRYFLRPLLLRLMFTIIVLAVVSRPDLNIFKPLRWEPLRFMGRLSYSLYLWHVPVFAMLANERVNLSRPALVALRVVVSFAAALASYHFIEQPMIRYGRKIRGRAH